MSRFLCYALPTCISLSTFAFAGDECEFERLRLRKRFFDPKTPAKEFESLAEKFRSRADDLFKRQPKEARESFKILTEGAVQFRNSHPAKGYVCLRAVASVVH